MSEEHKPHSEPNTGQSSVSTPEEEIMEERCPVCLTEDAWEMEYDYTENGEIEQLRCQKCGWPPTYPSTVEQWRRHYFISPYLTDLEAMVAERDEKIKGLEEQLEATEKALDNACFELTGTPVEAERLKRGYLRASYPASEPEASP